MFTEFVISDLRALYMSATKPGLQITSKVWTYSFITASPQLHLAVSSK